MFFDKPKNSASEDEPMFHMPKGNNYGRTANLRNKITAAEYDGYKDKIKAPAHFPISDMQFLDFEIELSCKHAEEFTAFINAYGGLQSAKEIFDAASKPSWLINYWTERKEEYESTFPESYGLETCEAYSA